MDLEVVAVSPSFETYHTFYVLAAEAGVDHQMLLVKESTTTKLWKREAQDI